MTDFELIYLVGWILTVFDVPAGNKSIWWSLGAAFACAIWPFFLIRSVINAAADTLARTMK